MNLGDEDEFDWGRLYLMTRSILGWSDEEFWRSTPKIILAQLLLNKQIAEESLPEKQKPLHGEKAVSALKQIMKAL